MARGLLVLVAALIILVLASGGHNAGAQTVEATWRLHDRANSATFEAGETALDPADGEAGYEIVSFEPISIAESAGTYEYGGPDLDPPTEELVSCDASFTSTAMSLHVAGAYPYAGCVFFVGAENTGEAPLRVDLGGLDDRAETRCNSEGCEASDLSFLAGGTDTGTVASVCHESGDVAHLEGLSYELEPGAEFVCPLFVTVLQPANEGTTYEVSIEPPPPEEPQSTPAPTEPQELATPLTPPPGETPTTQPPETEPPATQPPETEPPGNTPAPTEPLEATPGPTDIPEPGTTNTATPSPTATPTPTPVDDVEGGRTPGPDAETTPAPPDAGTGQLVVYGDQSGGNTTWLVAMLLLSAGGALLLPRRR